MNALQARQILLRFRAGPDALNDRDTLEALAAAREDAALAQWFERHCAFQAAMREKFRALPVPPGLRERIIAVPPQVLRPTFWQRPAVWLAAAAVWLLLLALSAVWFRPRTPDQFADLRTRMVRTVLREYRLEVPSNDPQAVRDHMAGRGAPADYVLPPGLENLQLAGGGFLRWRNHPVSMVCFYRPDKQMVYLFVIRRSAISAPPTATPQTAKINKLLTASWTRGDNVYLLAGPEEPDFYRKYL